MQRICSLFLVVISLTVSGQVQQDSIASYLVNRPQQDWIYQLYPTQNMYMFLKLDTRNGRIWQVQYSMEDNRFESVLNIIPLVSEKEEFNGRFKLYPTESIYTYILLDRISGDTYQVQWSQELGNRLVIPIN
jgi:hypothetical protein